MIAHASPGPSRRTLIAIAIALGLAFVAIAAFVPRGSARMTTERSEMASIVKKIPVVTLKTSSIGAAASTVAERIAATNAESTKPGHRLARSANVGLIVDDVDASIARIETLARRNGAEIVALGDNAPATPGDRHTAELTLGVPDERFETVLGTFGNLGTISSRTIATEDLGDKLVDANARLRNLRREENDLRRIMDRSGKVGEILDVEGRLASVRESIETLDAQRAAMERRVVVATISLSLSDVATTSTLAPTAVAQLGDAWRAALANVQSFSIDLAARVFVAVAFAPYLLASLVAALALRRLFARRFRGA